MLLAKLFSFFKKHFINVRNLNDSATGAAQMVNTPSFKICIKHTSIKHTLHDIAIYVDLYESVSCLDNAFAIIEIKQQNHTMKPARQFVHNLKTLLLGVDYSFTKINYVSCVCFSPLW